MNGCTQLSAVNFDPNATVWDYNCIYIIKSNGVCLKFKDVENMIDNSFTLSYSVEGNNWVFFHDYIPDFYFHTRESLLNVYSQKLFKHNEGRYGFYHEEFERDLIPKSFFVDIVFNAEDDILLETVNWVSSVLEDSSDASNVGSEWNTLTHISIWNSQQHTGRIPLDSIFKDLQYTTSRSTNGHWSFNDFRNIVEGRGNQFIQDLFHNYNIDPSYLADKAWYEKELIQDKYVIVRFEFDNSLQKQLLLHDVSVQAIKAKR